jgi:hypothetical protein
MKSTVVSLMLAVVMVGGLYASHHRATAAHYPDVSSDVLTANSNHQKVKPTKMMIEVDYADMVTTIDDLRNNSDLIVYGRVISHEQFSDYAVTSTVAVTKVKRGEVPDSETITVFQIGTLYSSEVLTINKPYLLFLGKQSDDQDDSYFIKGGLLGIAEVDHNQLFFYDKIIRKDYDHKFSKVNTFDAWLQE